MTLFTMITGLLLMLLGGIGYYLFQIFSVLIPFVFGFIILLGGIFSRNEKNKRVAIHITVIFVLLGLIGSWSGIVHFPGLLFCAEIATCDVAPRPMAELFKAFMFMILFPHFVASIRFFIKARISK